MGMLIDFHKPVVAAALLVIGLSLPTGAAAKPAAELLAELHKKSGITILMVNHELHWMRQLATELIWLRDGEAVQGGVDELLSPERIEQMLQLQMS